MSSFQQLKSLNLQDRWTQLVCQKWPCLRLSVTLTVTPVSRFRPSILARTIAAIRPGKVRERTGRQESRDKGCELRRFAQHWVDYRAGIVPAFNGHYCLFQAGAIAVPSYA